ncbi:MAG: AAA family ATPase [Clostridiales bacterium]|nr:AAA family ATPase [Clostridiales bacterium]
MKKVRIIIADTDVNYILALQLKFIEEFDGKANLEVITDRDYFKKLFSSPQTAQVLVFSEDMYDPSLHKHNIAHLFQLTEEADGSRTGELDIDCIYKYSSIPEIFNVVIGKCADVLHSGAKEKKVSQIVVVTSAAGGVGKTTVAMGLCAALSRSYKKVLYIDAERLQTFQFLLRSKEPLSGDIPCRELTEAGCVSYQKIRKLIRKEEFAYLPPFRAALLSLGVSPDVFGRIAKSAKLSGEYDYVVVDTDSVFDENKAGLIDIADKVIVVTRQNLASVTATNVFTANVNGIDGDKYLLLCNDYDPDAENAAESNSVHAKFAVTEYIGHINGYDGKPGVDFAEETGFKRAVYLLD